MRTSKLTPVQAVAILANEGITVSEEEAEKILEFIYFLAEITMTQILNSKEEIKEDHISTHSTSSLWDSNPRP